MPKINVLHIIGSLQYGGAEKLLVTLLKKFDKEKYKFTVCCLDGGGPLESEIDNLDIDVIKLGMSKTSFPFAFCKLLWMMKTKKIKIVHTHLYGSGYWGRIAAKMVGVPIIITGEYGLTLWKKRRHILFERLANCFTDMRITDGEDIRRNRITREKIDPQKIITILGGVDIDRFDPSVNVDIERKELNFTQNTFCVGTLSRLVQLKGLNYLLEATKEIIDVFPTVLFLIAGDGPARKELEDYAIRLGIEKNIIFTGYCSENQKVKMLALMDIFVTPSTLEGGVPVSLLEAIAMQKPIIATAVGAIPDVIKNGENGILIPPKNSKALSDAIIMLIKDKQLREKIAKNGHKQAKDRFSAESVAKKIEEIYDTLLRKKLIYTTRGIGGYKGYKTLK